MQSFYDKLDSFTDSQERKRWLKKQLQKASKLCAASSTEVLKEFEALDDPLPPYEGVENYL